MYVLISTHLHNVIETDQVAIDIGKDITRKVGVEKHRPGTYKRLNQTFALGQMPFNIIKQGILAPCPLHKSAIFLHAD